MSLAPCAKSGGLHERAVIVSACRTPIGSFQGKLCRLSATQLGSVVIKEALDRTRLVADQVDEVIMGNVLSAGLGKRPRVKPPWERAFVTM